MTLGEGVGSLTGGRNGTMGEGNAFIFCEVKSSKKNEKNNDLRCQVEHLDDALK